MSIHTGVLYQKPASSSDETQAEREARAELRLALLHFLAPFGWTEVARVGDWVSFPRTVPTGIVLSHPKWGCIYWGSNGEYANYLALGISSSSGDDLIFELTSVYVLWNYSALGGTGPAVTYIEHDNYAVLKISTTIGVMSGNMFFASTGSYQFLDKRVFNSAREQTDYFCPTTRYTSSIPEDLQIGLEKNVFRKFSGDSTGLLTIKPIPGFVTYSYGSVLPVGEYLINGKRYYQFSTNLYVLAEI